MTNRNKKWSFKFLDRFERRRARNDGYALILLRPNTPKEERALVEFEHDGITPIRKRFPLRYYDTCAEFNVLPSEASLYYSNIPRVTMSPKKLKRKQTEKKTVNNILTSIEQFKDLFETEVLGIINNFSQVEDESTLIFENYTLDDSLLKEVEMYILGFDKVEDVEVAKENAIIKFRERM